MTKRTIDDEVCCDMACPCGCGCRFHGGFPWDICECEWCTARREREQALEEDESSEAWFEAIEAKGRGRTGGRTGA